MIRILLIDPSIAVPQFAVSSITVYQNYNTIPELSLKDNETTLNIQLFKIQQLRFINFGLSNLD